MGRQLIKNRSLQEFTDYLLKIEDDYIQSTGMKPYVWHMNSDEITLCASIQKGIPGTTTGHKPMKEYSLKRFTFID